MGCLKNITRAVFLTLVIVGLTAFYNKNLISEHVNNFIHFDNGSNIESTKKVGDFSKIDKEYEVEKSVGMLGYNAVLAEHKSSGQKLVVVNSGKKSILTQDDIKSNDAESRIKNAVNKIKYQSAALEEFHITERGMMDAYGQKNVPYVKFKAKLKNIPMGEIEGIISVVKDKNGSDKILVSASRKNKYSQVVSKEFFNSIR